MSYLDVPRLHFAGRFSAAPSTVNNLESNYGRPGDVIFDGDKNQPDYAGWNPRGTHWWRLDGCTVRSVVDADGQASSAPGGDLVGASVVSTDQPSAAKLVDLDPEQQMASQIWGLRVRLETAAGDFFEGTYAPGPFNDLWPRAQSGAGFMNRASACYQSVLQDVTWSGSLKSPLLRKLKSLSPGALSVKFMVDSYEWRAAQPDFTFGRVVGTIGPVAQTTPAEPINFVAARLLRPLTYWALDLNPPQPPPPLFYAPARVDAARSRLLLDLGNSVPTQGPHGPLAAAGNLQAALLAPGAAGTQLLGQVAHLPYEQNAGVYELPLTAAQVALSKTTPLGVVRVNADGSQTVLLKENSLGAYLDATQYVFRLNPNDAAARVTVVASAFGQPKAGQKINVTARTADGAPLAPDTPPLKYPASVTTNAKGRAVVTLAPSDPGEPRAPLDGQVYLLTFTWDAAPADYVRDASRRLSVLLFSGYQVPASPKWADIAPIFGQYAKLYPFMKGLIDLGDYAAVQQRVGGINHMMSLPESDPGYMPVTRDLSKNKRRAILDWIKKGAPR